MKPMKRKNKSIIQKINSMNSVKQRIILECCICRETTESKDFQILFKENTQIPIKLSEYQCSPNLEQSNQHPKVPNNTIFKSCCDKHSICYECLYRIATNYDNHPIGQSQSLIQCPDPFEQPCLNDHGFPHYFTHSSIEKILSKEDFQMYMNHADRYQFPGYELVRCPRPISSRSGNTLECGAGMLIPLETIKTAKAGYLIMICDQNEDCGQRRTCYHCQQLVARYAIVCDFCVTSTENTNPRALNRYFYRNNKKIKDGQSPFYRNHELTKTIACDQLYEMIKSDKLYIRCMECLTVMYKTEQCNTLTHCGIERCYACGRSGTFEQDLGDHWDGNGVSGCPRWDYSHYWTDYAKCKFICKENECYNDELGICNVESHQEGIQQMIELRKKAHIYHAINSLMPSLKTEILETLWKDKKARDYLPIYWSSDYRTHNSDVIQGVLKLAVKIMDEWTANRTLSKEHFRPNTSVNRTIRIRIGNARGGRITRSMQAVQTSQRESLQFYQNIIDKCLNISFHEYEYKKEEIKAPIVPPIIPLPIKEIRPLDRLVEKYLRVKA